MKKRSTGTNGTERKATRRSTTGDRQQLLRMMGPPPAGYSHWSTRMLARRVGLGATVVHKIFRGNDLKPHLHRTFRISGDSRFAEKVANIVGLYLIPPPKSRWSSAWTRRPL